MSWKRTVLRFTVTLFFQCKLFASHIFGIAHSITEILFVQAFNAGH